MTRNPARRIAALCVASALAFSSACGPSPRARACVPRAGTICTIAGTGTGGLSGELGPGWAANLYLPMDAQLGPDGRLYIVDWNNHVIRAMPLAPPYDGVIETVVGSGQIGDGPAGPPLGAAFNHPTNILFDPAGVMWIAAWHNSRVRRVDMRAGMLTEFAGTGRRAYIGDEGPCMTASFDLPAGLARGPSGDLYVVDQANQVVRRIDHATGVVTRVAGRCLTTMCPAGEMPTQCPGTDKWACASVDPMACALPCMPGYGGDGGPALEARLAMPFGQAADPAGRIAVASDGTIFIADTSNHRVRRVDPAGMITTVAGTGARGFAGDGGPATSAQLDSPVGLALARDGTLYIADTMNSCIRALGTDGVLRTAVGMCGMRGFAGDGGSPTAARLDRPYAVGLGAHGEIFVVDTHNQRVRIVIPALAS